jgi:hypothetical protein
MQYNRAANNAFKFETVMTDVIIADAPDWRSALRSLAERWTAEDSGYGVPWNPDVKSEDPRDYMFAGQALPLDVKADPRIRQPPGLRISPDLRIPPGVGILTGLAKGVGDEGLLKRLAASTQRVPVDADVKFDASQFNLQIKQARARVDELNARSARRPPERRLSVLERIERRVSG